MADSTTAGVSPARVAGWRSELPKLALMLCLLFVARSSFANH
jgi:hypothetical protein